MMFIQLLKGDFMQKYKGVDLFLLSCNLRLVVKSGWQNGEFWGEKK